MNVINVEGVFQQLKNDVTSYGGWKNLQLCDPVKLSQQYCVLFIHHLLTHQLKYR